MSMRDLIPWNRGTRVPVSFVRNDLEPDPIRGLHREINRLFDEAWRGLGLAGLESRHEGSGWPKVEIGEDDKEVRVMAEVPGLTAKDVELTLDGDVLRIRGERKSQTSDEKRGYSECFYGRFERHIPLPAAVREEDVSARFANGVLTITMPKSEDAARARRIPIKTDAQH